MQADIAKGVLSQLKIYIETKTTQINFKSEHGTTKIGTGTFEEVPGTESRGAKGHLKSER